MPEGSGREPAGQGAGRDTLSRGTVLWSTKPVTEPSPAFFKSPGLSASLIHRGKFHIFVNRGVRLQEVPVLIGPADDKAICFLLYV